MRLSGWLNNFWKFSSTGSWEGHLRLHAGSDFFCQSLPPPSRCPLPRSLLFLGQRLSIVVNVLGRCLLLFQSCSGVLVLRRTLRFCMSISERRGGTPSRENRRGQLLLPSIIPALCSQQNPKVLYLLISAQAGTISCSSCCALLLTKERTALSQT